MAAAEALIVLSLLGCDDSGTQCDFIRVGTERFETVEACRAASEPMLAASSEADFPTVVAVCSPESSLPEGQMAAAPIPPETPAEVDGNAAVAPELPAETGTDMAVAEGVEPPPAPVVEGAPFPPAPPKAGEEPAADLAAQELAPLQPEAMEPEEKERGILTRVADAIAGMKPERETLTAPIDVAADGAAKVGGAVIVGVKRVAEAVNPF